jgi:TIR domain
MRAIFISYRRDDSEGQAGRLYDDLSRTFGDSSVFMDVAAIEPGLDFRKVIDHNVASCGVLLAVIGPGWLDAKDEAGQRRLDNPSDFVRLETASALKRDIPVVPVLVHGARMPRADQLPEGLGELAYRNGLELTHARWESDVEVLVKALQRHVKEECATPEQTSRAASAARRSGAPANAAQVAPVKNRGSLVAVGLVAAAGVAFGLYTWTHRSPTPDPGRTSVIVTTPAQSQPQQPAVSQSTKPPEQEVQSQPSQSPPPTTTPRSVVHKSPAPAVPVSPITKASAQTHEPATPAPSVPASDNRAGQTVYTNNGSTTAANQASANQSNVNQANPAAQSLPATMNPSGAYPPPMATQNSNAVNLNLPRFAVGHYGATAQEYCVGWMIIDGGFVRYRGVQGNHGVHTFDFPVNRIKEVKKNALVFSLNLAFHVRMDDGEVFNFSQVDPNNFRFQNPDALINAVHMALPR